MRYLVARPSSLQSATIEVPGDKSISHRALMLGAIADGVSRVTGFLAGEDCLATLAALERLGVRIERHGETELSIHGVGLHGLQAPAGPLDLGNSGTAMRLFTGLLAGQGFDTTLTGDESLSSRPMARVIDPLTQMGADIGSVQGRPPLEIRGRRTLHGIDYPLPVASAQVKSALLLAGLYADSVTRVCEPAVTRDHTERMFEAMGVTLQREGACLSLRPGATLQAIDIVVPGDLSSATFPMLAAILSDDAVLHIRNVGINPTRDGVLQVLTAMGADIRRHDERTAGGEPVADLEVRASKLKGLRVDPALVPLAIDEFPALFVAAACADGITEFSGLEELRVKESDRIAAMVEGLQALGVEVEERPDGAVIRGGGICAGEVDSRGDHRIAMAFAIAASVADGPVRIADTAAVATSFPGFTDLMGSIGLDITQEAAPAAPVPVVTIDGPSGSGKGTVARRVADALGYRLLDSGALYRLLGLAAAEAGLALDDEPGLADLAARLDIRFGSDAAGEEQIWLAGREVSAEIRTEEAGARASAVAALPAVREALLDLQRRFQAPPGLVADGRDMGTQVFPDAPLKVFLTASADERARRRHKQLKDKGLDVSLAALSRDIAARDRRDSERSVAPLTPAADARILDSSDLTIDAVCDRIMTWARDSGL